jgi:ABC-type transport system involved in cytochrome c biogenesis ATPase subunit
LAPQTIIRFQVEKLFGYLSHDVALRVDAPTLLTGPNGSGKTHVLKLLAASAGLDLPGLFAVRFERLTLTFTPELALVVEQSVPDEEVLLVLTGRRRGAAPCVAEIQQATDMPPLRARDIPPWVQRLGGRNWYDSKTEETISTFELRRRYLGHSLRDEALSAHPWLKNFTLATPPTFIETGRLDIERRESRQGHGEPVARTPQDPPIQRYVRQVRRQIDTARGASLTVSQRADRRFAARALDRARATVKESTLRNRYQALADLNHELHENGLTDETIEVALPPQKTNPTERRILDVFLEDWEEKLRPLVPVHEKLQLLRDIVQSKIRDKRLRIPHDADLHFVSATGEAIGVDVLSSGEQHMLALFAMFLFAAHAESLILIDEPEISLHAAWKHSFLEDMERVVELIPMQVVLATHSTGLINSRWDLVEELSA